ncbi:MAG TPA: hypothetical protein VF137_01445 [Candidatus Dormibacteraeota bacterium]
MNVPLSGTQAAGVGLRFWLSTRLVLAAFTIFAATLLTYEHLPRHAGLQLWQQWDTGWYLAISRQGYYSRQAAAFFPLYPALIGAVTAVVGDQLRLAVALAISNLGALAGLIGLALLARRESGGEGQAPALRMAVAYPFAFFVAAAYTEGLFLAFAVFALYWAREGRWLPAAAAAFLAGLTRNTGLILVLPLAWEFGRQMGVRSPLRVLGGLGVVLAAPAGLAVFVLYLWRRFGDPLLYVHAEHQYWNRELWPVWRTAAEAVHRLIQNHGGLLPVDLALVLFFLAVTVIAARRVPFAFTLYMLGVLYTAVALPQPVQHDLIPSAGRYLSVSIPAFLVLGRWMAGRPSLDLLLTAGGFMLQAGLLLTFLGGGPVY